MSLVFILQADVIQVSHPSTHMYIHTMRISPHTCIPIQDGVTADQVAEVEGNPEVCENLENIFMVIISHSVAKVSLVMYCIDHISKQT